MGRNGGGAGLVGGERQGLWVGRGGAGGWGGVGQVGMDVWSRCYVSPPP